MPPAAAGTATGEAASGPNTIPVRADPTTTVAPVVTTPDGAPALAEYHAPSTYYCLAQRPAEAQVTIGWSAPSATNVTLVLDGSVLPSGIGLPLPYEVPAGGPTGVGATVVFACDPAVEHTITVTWRGDTGVAVDKTFTITKGA